MSKTSSQPAARSADEEEIKNLKELAALLANETDLRSRQVILAEAAMKLIELENRLKRAS